VPEAITVSDPQIDTIPTKDVPRRGRYFFVVMACLMLVIVAVGFTPSFYWPGLYGPPEAATYNRGAPAYIFAHGFAMTGWFLLYLVQAIMVAQNRVGMHRQLGVAGVVLAAILVPLDGFVIARSVSRSGLGALPVLGDFSLLILFSILVVLSIRARSKPAVHKRLMLIATIAMTAPAIARWPGAESAIPLSVIVPQLGLMGAILVYDKVIRGRVHHSTVWGMVGYILALGIAVPLAASGLGQGLVESLK
jgi:hypothetical protein